jgi:hypothetical protein
MWEYCTVRYLVPTGTEVLVLWNFLNHPRACSLAFFFVLFQCRVQSAVCSVQCAVCSVQCAVCSTMYSIVGRISSLGLTLCRINKDIGFTILVTGTRFPGGFIGLTEDESDWVQSKMSDWASAIHERLVFCHPWTLTGCNALSIISIPWTAEVTAARIAILAVGKWWIEHQVWRDQRGTFD